MPPTPSIWTRASWPMRRLHCKERCHEVSLAGMGAVVPQQDPHLADLALGGRGVFIVRHARFGARGLYLRRQRQRRGPAGGGIALVDHPIAADQSGKPDPQRAGRARCDLGNVVRRHLPRPEELFPNFRWRPISSMCTANTSCPRTSSRRSRPHAPARSLAKAWPRKMAGRSATPFRCRPPSFRAAAATTGRCNWSASSA